MKSNNKFIKLAVGIISTLLVIVIIAPTLLANRDIVFTGLYNQTGARNMLNSINELRQPENAWYNSPDNTTKIYISNLQGLTYDYNLEQIAIQRAAEIMVYFSHTRPNISSNFTCTYNGVRSTAENITYNHRSGDDAVSYAFTQFAEENKPFEEQGHRLNMLSSRYRAVGIAVFEYNGTTCVVQEFGMSVSAGGDIQTPANDSMTTVSVDLDTDAIEPVFSFHDNWYGDFMDPVLWVISTTYGTDCIVPTIYRNYGNYYEPIDFSNVTWTFEDSNIGRIENGVFIPQNVGKTTVTATISEKGKTYTATGRVIVYAKKMTSDIIDVTYDDSFTYNGQVQIPDIVVSDGDTVLTRDVDYNVVFDNSESTNVGYYRFHIYGIGNYTNKLLNYSYRINGIDISNAEISCDESVQYTGSAITPNYSIKMDGVEMDPHDYEVTLTNNRVVGDNTATITFRGRYNYCGERSFAFSIVPHVLTDSDVTITPISDKTYTGEAIEPSINYLMYGSRRLYAGSDYTLSYQNNLNPGTATVLITFINNYSGSISTNFDIVPKNISYYVFATNVVNPEYTGSPVMPTFDLLYNGNILDSSNYTVYCENNTNVGSATAIVTFTGNYTGTCTVNFRIRPKDISTFITVDDIPDQTYTGGYLMPECSVRYGDSVWDSSNYSVTYYNNIRVGTGNIRITGIGNYTGTVYKNFDIVSSNSTNVDPTTTPAPTVSVVPTTIPTTAPIVIPTNVPTMESTVVPTNVPTNTPTSPNTNDSENGVGGFVERLYTIALNRPSDPNGKADWVNRVYSQGATGADISQGFLFSPEFLDKQMSNYDFLEVLYRVFFDRVGDTGGINYWLTLMANGMDKQTVIWGFINSTEWANVCLRYGIASGGNGVPNISIQPSEEIVAFATRLYTTCLGREADQVGLMDWATRLANRQISGSDAARGFFTSSEFVNAGYDNVEYINRLYRTFMGRPADQGGMDYWLDRFANGATREDVFNGFANSNEFAEICSAYGIVR